MTQPANVFPQSVEVVVLSGLTLRIEWRVLVSPKVITPSPRAGR
jgi:hypothetical protein